MKKIFLVAILLVTILPTSCSHRNEADITSNLSEDSISYKQVASLIERIEQGDSEAYKTLGDCYQYGTGVPQSHLNMLYLYHAYSQVHKCKVTDLMKGFDKNSMFYIRAEMLNKPLSKDFRKRFDKAVSTDSAFAIARKASWILHEGTPSDTATFIKLLQDAEQQGDEHAFILLSTFYKNHISQNDYEKFLREHTLRYPYLWNQLGSIYAEKYEEIHDTSYLYKSLDSYQKAKSYGMLSPLHAKILLDKYQKYSKELRQQDAIEKEKIEKLCKNMK